MAWSRNQIITVQIYRRAAGLADPDYRHLLKSHTGAFSSKEPALTQWDFDTFMPILEMKAQEHHERTGAPLPKQVRQIRYWRTRCPQNGEMNSRQRHRIFDPPNGLWVLLQPYLPPEDRTLAYLCGIAEHACGYRIGDIWSMKAWQASLLIEALKDRLKYALRSAS